MGGLDKATMIMPFYTVFYEAKTMISAQRSISFTMAFTNVCILNADNSKLITHVDFVVTEDYMCRIIDKSEGDKCCHVEIFQGNDE